MEDYKKSISSLFEEALPFVERRGNGGAELNGFEESANDDSLDRLFEIGDKLARIPSASEDDRRCKARIYRFIAADRSSVVDAPDPEQRLLWSIIDDLDPGER